jgi:dTDP-4-amino-4,6-dideoxygalactose transaminase
MVAILLPMPDVSTVSFYPAKVLGGCMDGGGIFVKDAVLAENIRKLGNHGRSSHYGYEFSGVNSRMSGLQARYLTTMLTKIDAIIEDRNASLALYREKIGSRFDNKLNLHAPPAGVTGNGYLQVMTLSAAPYDKVMAHMGEHWHRIGAGLSVFDARATGAF